VHVDSLGSASTARFGVASRRFAPGSVALGGAWALPAAGWTATATLARQQRAPKDYELYANGPHLATGAYETGQANLGPERSHNLELGLAYKAGRQRVNLNAYAMQYGNYINLAATGNTLVLNGTALPEYAYTQVRARFVGMEMNAGQRLWRGSADTPSLDLELKTDWVRATNQDTGQALPRIAPARVGTALVWALGPWGVRAGVDYHAAQRRVPVGERDTSAYTFWNASATYRQKAGPASLLWFARLENIGDRMAYSASSILTQTAPNRVPLPGRGVRLGLQATF
jgi:iron complex outermembrane receptor protein